MHNFFFNYFLNFNISRQGEAEESEVDVTGDVLVGADGAHSTLRQTILKRPGTNFSQTYIDHAYMELRVPAKDNGQVGYTILFHNFKKIPTLLQPY